MEQPQVMEQAEQVIDLREYLDLLRSAWWKILLLSLAAGIATLGWMLTKPNYYRASATITPATEEGKQNPALGALASFGVSVGGPTKVADLEALFNSNDLAVRVFSKYPLWPIVLPEVFDPITGKTKGNWKDRLFGKKEETKPPGDWDAIRAAANGLVVSVNRKNGTLSLSFESPSAEGSANIVRYYIDEAKSRLQEEALERAVKNKKFIEEQIGRTVDALTRDRLYGLYGQEVEREMMARNREQFGFRVIDSPRVPDRKFKPNRSKSAFLATVLSFFAGCVFFVVREKYGKSDSVRS